LGLAYIGIEIGKFLYAKIGKNKPISREEVRKIMKEECENCGYKKQIAEIETVEKQMAIAIRIMLDLWGHMKSDFLSYVVDEKICNKNKALDLNNYTLFENTFNHSKEKILDELRSQFVRNKIAELSSYEIEARSTILWRILTDIFDKFYKTLERPTRIELYEFSTLKEDKYINILSRIYEDVKNIKK
jgi:hypothetical protein